MADPLRIGVAVKHGIDVGLTKADRATGVVDLSTAPRKMSDFDRNAVEEAVRVREQHGGTVTAISIGSDAARAALREAVEIGADQAVLVSDPSRAEWDTRAVSRLLAASWRKLGGFDLLLLGEGSTDHYSGIVGPRVAGELGIACLAHVRRLTVEAGGVVAEKDLDTAIEVHRAPFPVVISVGQEINEPRVPTFSGKLRAQRKEIGALSPAALGIPVEELAPSIVTERVTVPEVLRKGQTIAGGSPEEVAAHLVAALREGGVLP